MKFVAPNAVPRTKRNFTAALDRMFFFDDQTLQSELTYDNWHMLVPKVRAGSYTFESGVWKTGHVQGQGDASRYYPANLGALQENTGNSTYSNSSTPVPPSNGKPTIQPFLTFDLDDVNYLSRPFGVNPKRIYGWGGNGFSGPDTRMLYAMKPINFPTSLYGKLPSPFPKSNTYYTIGGGYNSQYIQYWGYTTVQTLKPKTVSGTPDSDMTINATSIANATDPNLAIQPAGAQVGQLMIVERTEFYRYQQIYAAGSGARDPVFFNQYNWSNLTSVGMKDDATFKESTVQPLYYPLAATAETPNITWGALLCRLSTDHVFIKLDSTDIVSRTVTPGTSAQITAQKTFPVPITDQQIFLM